MNFHFWKTKTHVFRVRIHILFKTINSPHFNHLLTLIDGISIELLNFNPSTGELLKINDLIANKSAFTNLSQQHFNAAIQTSNGINFEDYFFW